MTLVVGRRFENSVRLVADSKMTDPRAGSDPRAARGYLTGALKLVIIDQSLCIGCAGLAAPAFDAIRTASTDKETDVQQIEWFLQSRAQQHDGKIEFLVASIRGRPSLSYVGADRIQREPDQQWIGDNDAFDAYQRYRAEWWRRVITYPDGLVWEIDERERSEEYEARQREVMGDEYDEILGHQRIVDALEKVIADPSIDGVDEFAFRVVGDWPQGFRYLFGSYQYGGIPSPDTDPGVVHAVSAALGGFGYRIGPAEPGVGAIGVYFYQGRFGAFFYPVKQAEPFIYRDVDLSDFPTLVAREHGVTLMAFA